MKNAVNFVVDREDMSIVLNLSKYNNKYTLLIHLDIPDNNFSRNHKQSFGQKKFNILYRNLCDLINKRNIDEMGLDLLNNKDITVWHEINKWLEPVLIIADITEDRMDLVSTVLFIEELEALYDYFLYVQNSLSEIKYQKRINEQYFELIPQA